MQEIKKFTYEDYIKYISRISGVAEEGEDIFFLIEQQSQIDYSMPYRILNYSVEIIRNAVNQKRLKNKSYKMPVVYPIVLYTGNKKWKAKEHFEQSQMRYSSINRRIGEEEIQDFIQKMKNKQGGKDMLTALEEYFDSLIDEGIEKGEKTGKLEMLKQAIKNMIQMGEKDEKIMKYMGIEKEELEKIKGMI